MSEKKTLTLGSIFKNSSKEIFQLKKMVFVAMLLALVTVLKLVGFNNDYVKMGFNAIPANMAYYILGPVGGPIFAIVSDLLGTFILGQTPNPLITLVAALNGFIVGFILYGHPVSVVRVIIAVVLKALICSIFLNTLVIALSYGYNFQVLLISRLTKNAVEVPLTIVIYYLVAKGLEKAGLFKKLKSTRE